jgi:hypothetical protein
MNKIKNYVFTFIAVVLVQFVALAEPDPPPPGTSPDPGDFGGGDNPTDLPIDTYLWVLMVIGLCYVFYKFKNRIKLKTFSDKEQESCD